MITISNLKQVLTALGFTARDDDQTYTKHFENTDCNLTADFKNQKLIYPAEKGFIVNDGTTSNFEHPENFVVFECVCRLLEKGYRPEHIELEPRWSLGHGGKSGKADICVKNKDGSPYLAIIECKTAGAEYKKELSNMKEDGGQLFSYWQQSKATKWLVLYASDFEEEKISYTTATVNCSDDANFMELAKDDKTLKLYKDATTVENLFEVWKETYEQKFLGDILFDSETVAYDIGILPLKKKRLVDFSRDDKIVNRFEEILRHNNVSDKENAFNRLIALFIAKLYDEKTKTAESEVDFQYKSGTDTYQTMQDRLQKLHHFGMKEFMKEDVFYVADDYIKTVLHSSLGENRKQLEDELNETITKLKFYTNNDFAFKDVHNKALFYQNGKILVEMVELFQKYRIIDSKELQLLGDMFEQLLNKGFKQNEGQFFTPVPITSFIWKCLPLENIVQSDNTQEVHYPKIIDYACGAGHFLTEGFREINEAIARLGLEAQKGWERGCIYGIEKDYRLARVSKISLFMHGADNGNIVFGDGLDNHDKDGVVIQNGQFDILVANPPYSVSAFKNHLDLKNNTLSLLDYISKDGKEIETLFVERIAQLLKPKGIAAVILPSSILSNSSTSYIKAREEILKNFEIRSIVQFSSKTFGATGTNTVVLFMQKNDEPSVKSQVTKDNVNAILSNEELGVESDKEIFVAYCKKIEVSEDDYKQFAKDARAKEDYAKYREHAYFGLYAKDFEASADYKTATKQDERLSAKDEKTHRENRIKAFYEYALGVEKEKLYYFALVYKQTVLVVNAPSADKEQEKFLGYTWSNRKGDEGIKIKGDALKSCGLLYNTDDEDSGVARYVKDAFLGIYRSEGSLSEYVNAASLKDMLDFSRTSFDKAIKCNVKGERGELKIESKYPLVKLGEMATVISGQSPESKFYNEKKDGLPFYQGKKDFGEKFIAEPVLWTSFTTKESVKDDILMSVRAPVGDVNINPFEKICIGRGLAAIRCKDSNLQIYLFNYLRANKISGHSGTTFDSISRDELTETKLPLPPIDVQKSIVAECEAVDAEYTQAQKTIEAAKTEIARIMENVHNSDFEERELATIIDGVEYGTSKKSEQQGKVPVIRMGNIQDGKIDMSDLVYSNDDEDIAKYALKKYDVLFNRTNSPEHVGKVGLYLSDEPAIFAGYLIRIHYKPDVLNPCYLAYMLNSKQVREYGFSIMSKSINQANISGSELKKYKIPVPPLAEQLRIVEQVGEQEQKIAQAKKIMAECPEQKKSVLAKWL